MSFSSRMATGRSLSEAVTERYKSIGEGNYRQSLSADFDVENRRRSEGFGMLADSLLIGSSLYDNYQKSKEMNTILGDNENLKKESGWFSDIFGTPEYSKDGKALGDDETGFLYQKGVYEANKDLVKDSNKTNDNSYKEKVFDSPLIDDPSKTFRPNLMDSLGGKYNGYV